MSEKKLNVLLLTNFSWTKSVSSWAKLLTVESNDIQLHQIWLIYMNYIFISRYPIKDLLTDSLVVK